MSALGPSLRRTMLRSNNGMLASRSSSLATAATPSPSLQARALLRCLTPRALRAAASFRAPPVEGASLNGSGGSADEPRPTGVRPRGGPSNEALQQTRSALARVAAALAAERRCWTD